MIVLSSRVSNVSLFLVPVPVCSGALKLSLCRQDSCASVAYEVLPLPSMCLYSLSIDDVNVLELL